MDNELWGELCKSKAEMEERFKKPKVIELTWEEYVNSVLSEGEDPELEELDINEIIEIITDVIEMMIIISIIAEPEKTSFKIYFMEDRFYKYMTMEKIEFELYALTQGVV